MWNESPNIQTWWLSGLRYWCQFKQQSVLYKPRFKSLSGLYRNMNYFFKKLMLCLWYFVLPTSGVSVFSILRCPPLVSLTFAICVAHLGFSNFCNLCCPPLVSLSFSISLVKTFCLQSLIVKKTMYLYIFYLDQIKLDIFHTCRWVNVLCG